MTFASDLEKFAKLAEGNMDTVIRKVSFEISKSLIEMSPVDTGRFRNNWYLSQGTANSATNTGTDLSGARALARVQGQLAGIKAGKSILVTNSLPYAIKLEFGHSRQSPAGMVRITAARFSKFVSLSTVGLKT